MGKHTRRFNTPLMLLDTTPRLFPMDMEVMVDMDMASARLNQAKATPLVLSAIRLPSRTLARFLARNARPLLTPPTLRSARTSSPPTARRPPSRSTTPLRLLDMTPRLCLMDTVVMEDMATEVQTYECSLLIIGI